MPTIRELRDGTFSTCTTDAPRSFAVSYDTWADWLALGPRPRDSYGRRLRPYGAMDVPSHPPYAPDGIYVDHRDPMVESAAYELRDRLLSANQGASQATLEPLATQFGLRHWRDAYNTVRNVGRRITGESGRDSDGELRWRRWNAPRNMRQTPAAPARQGSRSDSSLVARRFGIEIEFNGRDYGIRDNIVRDLVAAGFNAQVEGYNHNTRPHWKMTTDATVTGGELVSPIMAGDTASLDEVRDCIRVVKANSGTTAIGVGMHVHHDVTDFDTATLRALLVDALQASEAAMIAYVPRNRTNGMTSHGGQALSDREWDIIRRAVPDITPGARPGNSNYQDSVVVRAAFYNITAPMWKYGTVEFRGLGATLHAGKVRVWVRMGQAIIEAARTGVEIEQGCTPAELAATLRTAGLIGATTASKFVAECERRQA
ncbi:MAG: amidoligase family protein [Thermoanaerobaculales bacterium]|nr:amidoligase family protein [Thermoanaerobaculales bacterium]